MEERTIDYVFKLLDIPWWYYAIAVLLGVAAWQVWKRPSVGLLVGYAFFLFAKTVLIREPFVGQHFQPQLFWSWRVWIVQKEQILTNVLMFIPIGVFTGLLLKWQGVFIAAGMSIVIEILQLITARGLCEIDDVLHNCFGAAIGIGIVMLVNRLFKVGESK